MIDYRKNEGGILEISVAGRLTKEEIDAVWARMKVDMPAGGKVKVLEVIRDFEGWTSTPCGKICA
jgi:hypothetical protein